jgi:VIT1/CCC1 family predicted Fe2+/Mn2+ transporter
LSALLQRPRNKATVLIAGIAGAGGVSMAAGEYVSVSSQSDTEQADLARERNEQVENPESELDELPKSTSSAASTKRLRARLLSS